MEAAFKTVAAFRAAEKEKFDELCYQRFCDAGDVKELEDALAKGKTP